MSDESYHFAKGQLTFGHELILALLFSAVSATGTHGAMSGPTSGFVTFTDTTAAAFTSAMVGQTITISGSSHAANNGTFLITSYTSSSVIGLYNPYAVSESAGDTWSVVPEPTVSNGDQNQSYMSVDRVGTGKYLITTTDGWPQFVRAAGDVLIAVNDGGWHAEIGQPVQNTTGLHPFFLNKSTPVNSYSVPITVYYNSSAADLVPASAVTGTHGAPSASVSGAALFTDSTAGAFTPNMVGLPITISGDTNSANNGTFTILQYVNANAVMISNAAAVGSSGDTWSVQRVPQLLVELNLNNGPPQ